MTSSSGPSDGGVGRTGNWRQVARRRFDPVDGGEFTAAVVGAIADAEGVEPGALSPPLYEYVDPSAVEATLLGRVGTRRAERTVEFRYDTFLVRARSDGSIEVYERSGTDDPGSRDVIEE